MLCKFLAVPCVGVFGQMNQFPWEKDGSSSDICPAPCVQQVSTKKLFIRIFDQKKYLEQGFPKFSRNESQWQLTNKKREKYLICSIRPKRIRPIIPIIAVINILVINICTLTPGPRNRLTRLPWKEDQRHLGGPKSRKAKKLNRRMPEYIFAALIVA